MLRLVILLFSVAITACVGHVSDAAGGMPDASRGDALPQLLYEGDFLPAIVTKLEEEPSELGGSCELLSTPHDTFALAPARDMGSFGTFHLAVDKQGRAWGIKRLARHKGDGLGLMSASTDAEVRHEFGVAEHVLVDRFKVHAIAQNADETFVVLTLWAGDLSALRGCSRDDTRLLRVALARVGHDIVRLHAAGYIHHDIRSANILWNASGDMALWDFGLAGPTSRDGTLERTPFGVHRRVGRGTRVNRMIMAPEVDGARYTNKTDTWSLGLTVLDMFSIEEDECLFNEGLVDLVAHTMAYKGWYEGLARSPVATLSCKNIAHPDSVDGNLQHWYFAAMYHELNKRDPQLCDLVLEGMLVPNPDERWDMKRVVGRMSDLVTETDMRDVASALKNTNDASSRHTAIESLRAIMRRAQ